MQGWAWLERNEVCPLLFFPKGKCLCRVVWVRQEWLDDKARTAWVHDLKYCSPCKSRLTFSYFKSLMMVEVCVARSKDPGHTGVLSGSPAFVLWYCCSVRILSWIVFLWESCTVPFPKYLSVLGEYVGLTSLFSMKTKYKVESLLKAWLWHVQYQLWHGLSNWASPSDFVLVGRAWCGDVLSVYSIMMALSGPKWVFILIVWNERPAPYQFEVVVGQWSPVWRKCWRSLKPSLSLKRSRQWLHLLDLDHHVCLVHCIDEEIEPHQ